MIEILVESGCLDYQILHNNIRVLINHALLTLIN